MDASSLNCLIVTIISTIPYHSLMKIFTVSLAIFCAFCYVLYKNLSEIWFTYWKAEISYFHIIRHLTLGGRSFLRRAE
jgi:ABC-type polysaccharide/polyol phosphate export permease